MTTEPGAEAAGAGPPMSLLDHLDELRRRLVVAAAGLLIGFLACWWQADALMAWCQAPYERIARQPLAVMAVSEGFFVKVRLALLASLFLTAPWTAWQAWRFVRPALYAKERLLAIPFLVGVAGFFVLGGAFGYFVGLPIMLDFLLGPGSEGFTLQVRAESYVSTFTNVLVGLGLVFEAPVLTFFLARLGLVDHRWLLGRIRHATVIIFILAAVITPSGDVATMLVFAAPMMVLYFLSVGVAWAFARRDA